MFDYRQANLSEAQRAFCDYAVKLTLTPGQMTQQDVQRLRDVGYNDEQISLGVQVISYFNYINRVADGLGIEPEPWMTLDPDTWHANKGQFGSEG